jgi:hypothetical protein
LRATAAALEDFEVDAEASSESFAAVGYPLLVRHLLNLVRRVVDRVGHRAEAAHSALTLQQACLSPPAEAPRTLVVAGDGSMLSSATRRRLGGYRAVIYRGECRSDHFDVPHQRSVRQARPK